MAAGLFFVSGYLLRASVPAGPAPNKPLAGLGRFKRPPLVWKLPVK
jgi:hypothetical protein